MLAASSIYLASSMQILHHHNTDNGMIYQYCTHISPYPKIFLLWKMVAKFEHIEKVWI